MATKTVDGAGDGTEVKNDDPKNDATAVDVTKADDRADDVTETETESESEAAAETDDVGASDETAEETAAEEGEGPSGVGQGAAAVVSAVLGLVSLTGGWIGTVAAARETLIGQLRTASNAAVAKQIKEVYGDAWHTTALWAGLFALTALITGVAVLARPAFGAPGRPQAPWIKSVAWAGVSLGVIGLLLAVLKYSDALLALPTTS
ncbi:MULTISPECIES: hypothetical protein [Streptomyces]|uniref:hypothetical protein n=1 Tax=Streptomyces TaxID=1883 RepID=UPI002930F786|nr:hypothetical protein [Streptomyces sp. NEAU-HV9]